MTETQEVSEDSTTESPSQDDLGWSAANELLLPFGTVASNFSESIRTLMAAHQRGEVKVSGIAAHHVERFLRTDSIKITYYHFSKQFKPELFQDKKHVQAVDFLDAYSPLEHAAVIAFCYLFKTLSKKIEKDEWDFVQTPLYEALCTGGGAGLCIPQIGLGLGLIGRGLRYLAYAPFLHENRKEFKQYRRHLKSIDQPFDAAFEQEVWQCTSIQIAGLLLERMGFSQAIALQYMAAAERSGSIKPDEAYGIPFRLAECLVEAYMEGQDIPTSTPSWVGLKLELDTETRGNLLATLNKVFADQERIEWLNKTPSDISNELTPELFVPEASPEQNSSAETESSTEKQSPTNQAEEVAASGVQTESVVSDRMAPAASQDEDGSTDSETTVPSVASAPETPSEDVTDALDSLGGLDDISEDSGESEK
jgi:hypothetical protein